MPYFPIAPLNQNRRSAFSQSSNCLGSASLQKCQKKLYYTALEAMGRSVAMRVILMRGVLMGHLSSTTGADLSYNRVYCLAAHEQYIQQGNLC